MKTLVKRRPFGKTGMLVSEIGLGAMNLRLCSTVAEAEKMVNYVLDQGVNLIDTARAYNGVNASGEKVESEEIVGRVLASRTDIDEPIVIVTKGHNYTPEEFDQALSVSRQKLGIVNREGGLYIGKVRVSLVYFFHGIKEDRWQSMVSSDVISLALRRREEGLFTYLGFSSHYHDGKEIKAALDTGAFDVIELPYNVFNRSLGEDGELNLFRYAHEKGVAVINMKAFNGNGMVPMSRQLQGVCDIGYADMLRFCLSNPWTSTIDAGTKYPHEFQADIQASLLPPMTGEERDALKPSADRVSSFFNSICRECMHCMEKFECPNGVDFPKVLGVHARFTLAGELGRDQAPFQEQYRALSSRAGDCIACGQCLPWCEYHLDIPAMMARASGDFED